MYKLIKNILEKFVIYLYYNCENNSCDTKYISKILNKCHNDTNNENISRQELIKIIKNYNIDENIDLKNDYKRLHYELFYLYRYGHWEFTIEETEYLEDKEYQNYLIDIINDANVWAVTDYLEEGYGDYVTNIILYFYNKKNYNEENELVQFIEEILDSLNLTLK